MLVRSEGRLSVVQRPKPEAPASGCSPAQPMADVPTDRENKKPAVSTSAAEVREQINDMIRQNAPALTKAYNEALKKEAEEQALKKQPQKKDDIGGSRKESHITERIRCSSSPDSSEGGIEAPILAVPEGPLIIARRFNAGSAREFEPRAGGTPERSPSPQRPRRCKIPSTWGMVQIMNATLPIAEGRAAPVSTTAVPAAAAPKRHGLLVRVTHWLTTLAFLALLLSGGEIVLSHPRFYWGETGNVNMHPWLNLHLPSSRDTVPTGYGYVLPDQNGWSRYLHFQAAWLAVATGLLYLLWGLFAGHFRRNLVPASLKGIRASIVEHLRFKRPAAEEAWSYNLLQRITYLLVVFVLFPMMIWTGLAMSFGFDSAFPLAVRLLGGHQTARSLHFIVTISLVVFLLIHVLMVVVAGFRTRMRAMITGESRAALDRQPRRPSPHGLEE